GSAMGAAYSAARGPSTGRDRPSSGGGDAVAQSVDPARDATTHRLEASRVIDAAAGEGLAVLCDPDGHGATDAAAMLQSADGPHVAAVGDRFVVHMDREALGDYDLGLYDVTVIITRFVQDTEIEWTIDGAMKPPNGHVYGYRLTPTGDDGRSTEVVSYYDWSE